MHLRSTRLAASLGIPLVLGCLLMAAPVATASSPTWGTFDAPSAGDFVALADGSFLATDCGNARIYRIDVHGAVSVFAGAGPGGFDNGYDGDGGPALDAHFGCTMGILSAADGSVLVTDHLNDVIRRIDAHGIVTTIVGSGPRFTWTKGPWAPGVGKTAGDGGPALDAVLDAPWGIRLDRAGNLFIADRDHDAIRMVDRSGTIVTVAGAGVRGFGGDGGPATKAKVNRPLDVAFPEGGGFLIADENNARIRRVDAAGRITTFAGNGTLGCGGDGGRALDASLQNVGSLAIGRDGSVIAAQGECHRVRVIGPDGIIRPLVGSGRDGCTGLDGGLATGADLSDPSAVGFDTHGSLIVSDPGCQVLLRVDGAGRLHVLADLSTAGR